MFYTKGQIGKTVKAAGRTLIGKQGEDHNLRANVISKTRGFHLVLHFNFTPLRLIFFKPLPSVISKGRKMCFAQFMVGV